MYTVVYSAKARTDLKQLDLVVAQRIIKKVFHFANQDNPLIFAKKLVSADLGQYRFRIGDYRAIFDIDHKGHIHILNILRIKHRKDVYDL